MKKMVTKKRKSDERTDRMEGQVRYGRKEVESRTMKDVCDEEKMLKSAKG